jgi:hypothetical protein
MIWFPLVIVGVVAAVISCSLLNTLLFCSQPKNPPAIRTILHPSKRFPWSALSATLDTNQNSIIYMPSDPIQYFILVLFLQVASWLQSDLRVVCRTVAS